jgi:hypothetical protein
MLIKDYLSEDYPAFSPNEPAEAALGYAEDFGFTHVFAERDGVFLGAISKEFLQESPEKPISSQFIHLEKFAVSEKATIFDTIKLFHTFNSNLVPAIDENEAYKGYIGYDDVFCELSKYPVFSGNGALLTVETSLKNYSMTEVANIVEGSNSRFFGGFISFSDEEIIQITMRIGSENLSSINETFERYGYRILRKFYLDEEEELINERYKFLEKYLEI